MKYPKIIILAQGGTHGDFLCKCALLMVDNHDIKINEKGKTIEQSNFLKDNWQKSYRRGKKIKINYKFVNEVEVCHIWQEEFLNFKSRFFYINFTQSQIPIIKNMFLTKTCNGKIENVFKTNKTFLPSDLSSKITLKNFDAIWTTQIKNTLAKYKKQNGITAIKITDLYKFESLKNILKQMGVYNKTKEYKLKKMYKEWHKKNHNFIEQMLYIKK
tara:strand:+ start:19 stop:663 length:645 start_codon:yes stop_codon:yes gene_type:complete